jgi:hypothetical protein
MTVIRTRPLSVQQRQDMLLWITQNIDIVVESSEDLFDRWWKGVGWYCVMVRAAEYRDELIYELEIADERKAMEIALRWS